MGTPGNVNTPPSSESSSSSLTSESEIGTDIEMSSSNQPIKPVGSVQDSQQQIHPQPPISTFSSESREIEEQIRYEEVGFPARSISTPNEEPFSERFVDDNGSTGLLSTPSEGSYPGIREPPRHSPAASDHTFQPEADITLQGSISPAGSQWSRLDSTRERTAVPEASGLSQRSFTPIEGDEDAYQFNSFTHQRGNPSSPQSVQPITQSDPSSSNSPADLRSSPGEPVGSSSFDPFPGTANQANAPPWSSVALDRLRTPPSALGRSIDSFAMRNPADHSASEFPEASSLTGANILYEETDRAIDKAASSVTPAMDADFQKGSFSSSGLISNKSLLQTTDSVSGDKLGAVQTASRFQEIQLLISPNEKLGEQLTGIAASHPPKSNDEGVTGTIGIMQDVVEVESSATSSSPSSSEAESSYPDDAGSDYSHVTSTSFGVTQRMEATVTNLKKEQSALLSSDLSSTGAVTTHTSTDVGQKISSPQGMGVSAVFSSSFDRSTVQGASDAPSQRPSRSQTVSDVQKRKHSVGETISVTSRRKSSVSQTTRADSARETYQISPTASPNGLAYSEMSPVKHPKMPPEDHPEVPADGAVGPGRYSSTDWSSPMSAQDATASGTPTSVTKKSSIPATHSSGGRLFRTGSAFTGARFLSDAASSRLMTSADSGTIRPGASFSQTVARPAQTEESRGDANDDPESSRSSSDSAEPTEMGSTVSSGAAAHRQNVPAPSESLSDTPAANTLTSPARDDLSSQIHITDSSPSSFDAGRSSGSSYQPQRTETGRRRSQQPPRTKPSRSRSQQPQSAPSQQLRRPTRSRSRQQDQSQSHSPSQGRSRQAERPAASQEKSKSSTKHSQQLSHGSGSNATLQSQPERTEQKSPRDEDRRTKEQRVRRPDSHGKQDNMDYRRTADWSTRKETEVGKTGAGVRPTESNDVHTPETQTESPLEMDGGTPDEFRSQTTLVEACSPSRLMFCEGRVPYRTMSLPSFSGACSDREMTESFTFFEAISDCSALARELPCTAAASQPRPRVLPPCRHLWHEKCTERPFECANRRICLSIQQRCDGLPQCENFSYELDCGGCSALQFRCRSADSCVDSGKLWDDFADCTEVDDERNCWLKGTEFASASSSAERLS